MLSKELEATLNNAFRDARDKRHEFMTVEHLLLALLDNEDAGKVLKACGVQVDKLRHELEGFLEETTPVLGEKDERETQPTLGFQRVLQRAVFHVQSSGKKEATGANVLVAIFGERESQAVYFLNRQSTTRLDVVNFMSHNGVTPLDAQDVRERVCFVATLKNQTAFDLSTTTLKNIEIPTLKFQSQSTSRCTVRSRSCRPRVLCCLQQ